MWARSASARLALGPTTGTTGAASRKTGSAASVAPLVMMSARSTTFSSSRTFPGQS